MAEAAAPGWYPDPAGTARLRYWDGQRWTAGVSDGKEVGESPIDAAGAEAALEELADRRAAWPGHVAWVAVGAVVVATALAAVASVAVDAVSDAMWALIAIPQVILWGCLGVACVAASRRHGSGDLRQDYGLTFRWSDLPAGLGAGAVARLLGVLLVVPIVVIDRDLVGTNTTTFDAVGRDTAALTVLVVIAIVGAPIIEEVFFRGLFQRALEQRFPLAVALAVQALLFGLVHVNPAFGRTNVTIVVATAAAGAVFGFAARHARRLGPSIVGHALFNVLPVALILAT